MGGIEGRMLVLLAIQYCQIILKKNSIMYSLSLPQSIFYMCQFLELAKRNIWETHDLRDHESSPLFLSDSHNLGFYSNAKVCSTNIAQKIIYIN